MNAAQLILFTIFENKLKSLCKQIYIIKVIRRFNGKKAMKFWGFCLQFEGVAIEKEIGNILFAVFAATRDAFLASYAIFRREVLSVSAGSSLRQSRLRSSSSHRCRMTNFQACPQQNCWFEFRSIRPTANLLLRFPNFRFRH